MGHYAGECQTEKERIFVDEVTPSADEVDCIANRLHLLTETINATTTIDKNGNALYIVGLLSVGQRRSN